MSEAATKKVITVLSIDDEPENNQLMTRLFRGRAEYALLLAGSAGEGLNILESRAVDVALVDFSMPDMDGVTFLERARGLHPSLVGILVTGFPEMPAVLSAHTRGLVSHVVAKPWRFPDLLRTITLGVGMRDMKNAVARMTKKMQDD